MARRKKSLISKVTKGVLKSTVRGIGKVCVSLVDEATYFIDVSTAGYRIETLKEDKERLLERSKEQIEELLAKYEDCDDPWKIRRANKKMAKVKSDFNLLCKDYDMEIERLEKLQSDHLAVTLKA